MPSLRVAWVRKRRRVGSCLLFLGLQMVGGVSHGTPPPQESALPVPRTEYEVKAFLMVNFARFVEWPGTESSNRGGSIGVGILGRDPFGQAMEPYVGQLVKGRKIFIRRGMTLKDLADCRVLFVGELNGDIPRVLREARERSILTFGESDAFIRMGGMVRFLVLDEKIQMEVNRQAYTEAGLKINSHLLAMTTIVNP